MSERLEVFLLGIGYIGGMKYRSIQPSGSWMSAMQRCVMALSFALLAACGGGSGSSATASGGDVATSAAPAATVVASGSPEVPAATPVAHLSGSIVKGPVTGAQVCVYELIATGKGKQLGCTTSRADGSYTLSLEFAGEVVVEAVGGT